ncbi:FAD-binding oxidoreductase [Thalassobaculum sp.]|uniref:NAD(P)/FAD-dependent oxidoreductase n=1 Tax=Thalassobaculum sp. TaxID=2022740 RepID=UPI0032F00B05
MTDYADSYYARTRVDNVRRPALDGSASSEIAVIGGGMAGLSTALGLAERGHKVVVLEGRRVGWGASGRNGGFVSAGFALGPSELVRKVGRPRAQELYRLTQDAVALVRRRAEAMEGVQPIVDGIAGCSWFDDRDAVERRAAWMSETFGEHREVWPREKVRSIWRSPRYYDAVFNHDAFSFHSLNFTRGNAAAIEALGGTIYEDTPVRRVDLASEPKRIQTDRGTVTADQVVICCSGYIEGLVGPLSRAILPIGTYVVLTEPVGERIKDIIGAPNGVSDDRFANDYYRPLPDTRLLWGGRISRWTDPQSLSDTMMGDLRRVYPQLADLKAEVAWPGTMGYAVHKMPQIGCLRPGVWYSQAYGGHGMATTTMGGELVASAISESDERWRLFKPFGLIPAGGPLGTWYAQSVYWSYQARDAWNLWRQRTRRGSA